MIDVPKLDHIVQAAASARANGAVYGRAVTMQSLLARFCEMQECSFSMHGQPVAAEELMSPDQFLPALAWTTQEAGHRLLGVDLGCALQVKQNSLFGVRSVIPPVTGHIVDLVRGLFFQHYATETFGIRPQARIEVGPMCDMLRFNFDALLRSERVSPQGEIVWPQPSRLN